MRSRVTALVVGGLVVLAALTLIVWGLMWREETPWGFGLSLSTEVVGAFLTLISIEVFRWHWTARQEEQQKLPAKCVLCARLMQKIDEFLVSVLPVDQYKVTDSAYFARGKGYQIVSVPILERVNKQWPTELEQSIQDRAYFDRDLLIQADLWLGDIFNHCDTLADPELERRLVRLIQELKRSISSLKSVDWEDQRDSATFIKSLQGTTRATLEVRARLYRLLRQHFKVADESSSAKL